MKADWVVLVPATQVKPGELACLRCGYHYPVHDGLSIDMFGALAKAMGRNHRRCRPHPAGEVCTVCWGRGHTTQEHKERSTRDCASPNAWLAGPDTGLSSVTIWRVMMRVSVPNPFTPQDSDDLGRCVRLLNRFPGWRTELDKMRDVPGWAPIVDRWTTLEELYRAGNMADVDALLAAAR